MGCYLYCFVYIYMMVIYLDYVGVMVQFYFNDDLYFEIDIVCVVKDDLLLDFKFVKDEFNGVVLDVEYNVYLLLKKYKLDNMMFMLNVNQDNF